MDWTGLPNRSGKFGNYLASKVLASFRLLALAFFLGAASIVAYVSWRVASCVAGVSCRARLLIAPLNLSMRSSLAGALPIFVRGEAMSE